MGYLQLGIYAVTGIRNSLMRPPSSLFRPLRPTFPSLTLDYN